MEVERLKLENRKQDKKKEVFRVEEYRFRELTEGKK